MRVRCWIAARDFGLATSLDTKGDDSSLMSINEGLYTDVVSYMRCEQSFLLFCLSFGQAYRFTQRKLVFSHVISEFLTSGFGNPCFRVPKWLRSLR